MFEETDVGEVTVVHDPGLTARSPPHQVEPPTNELEEEDMDTKI